MPVETIVRICGGCAVGDDGEWLSDAVALLGAVTGIMGLIFAYQANRHSQRSHDDLILREEFSLNRGDIEAALRDIEAQLVVLRPSASGVMPLGRLLANFSAQRQPATQAAGRLMTELRALDDRRLFRTSWAAEIQPQYSGQDSGWDVLTDNSQPEAAHRAAAGQVVANLEAMTVATRRNIETAIHASLSAGRWPKPKRRGSNRR